MRKLGLNVLLALTLVAAQAAVASHVDVESHTVDATCAVCASSSTLSAANISRIELFLPGVHDSAAIHRVFDFVPIVFACSQYARAPPVLS